MIPESFSAIPVMTFWEKLLLVVEVAAVLALIAVILYFLLWRGSGDEEDKDH